MLRILKFIIFAPIFVALINFSVSNRGFISLKFWPLPYTVNMPIYLLLVAFFIICTFICAVLTWFSNRKIHRDIKDARKHEASAKEENLELRERIEKLKKKQLEN